jgi:ABC-type uncharacterized transport system auxiliary subunit
MAMAMLLGCTLQSCALFSKGEVTTRRYYSVELPLLHPPDADRRPDLALRVSKVSANRILSERIMFRASANEVGFYDDRVWTERPEAYLTRGLSRVLFEARGVRSIVGGPGPTLEVELLRFEEIKEPSHVARVRLAFALSDERTVSLQKTVSIDRPIAPTADEQQGAAVAQAMSEALLEAVSDLGAQVIEQLSKEPRSSR